jgi:hypothetical protein
MIMVQLVLSDEQMKLLERGESERVEILAPTGRVLGDFYCGFTPEEVQRALEVRKSNQPTFTTEEVLAHLRSLS